MATCQERGIVHMKDLFPKGKYRQDSNARYPSSAGTNTRTFPAKPQSTAPVSKSGSTNRPGRKAPSPPPLRKSNDVRSSAVYTVSRPNGSGDKSHTNWQQDSRASASIDNPVRPPRSKKRLAPQPPGPSQALVTRNTGQLSPSPSENRSDFHQSLSQLVARKQTAGPPDLGLPPRPPSPGIPFEAPPPIPTTPPYVPLRKAPPPPGPPPPPPGPPPPPPTQDRPRSQSSPGYSKKIIPPFVKEGNNRPQRPQSPQRTPPPPPLRPTSPPSATNFPDQSRRRYASPRRPTSPPRTAAPLGRAASPRRTTSPPRRPTSPTRPQSPPPPPPSPFKDIPPVRKMDRNHNYTKEVETESSLLSQLSEHGSSGYHSEFEVDHVNKMRNSRRGEVGEEEFTVTFDDTDSDNGFNEPSPTQTVPSSPHGYIYREYQGEDFSQYLKDDTEPIHHERYLTEKRYRKRKGSASALSATDSHSRSSTLQKKIGLRDRLSKVFTLTRSQKNSVPKNRPAGNIHTFSYTDSKSYDQSSDLEDMIPDTRSDFGATASYWNKDTLSSRTLRRKAQSELAYNCRSESDLTFATSGYVSDSSDGYTTKERKSKRFGFFKMLQKKRRPSEPETIVSPQHQYAVRPPSVEDIRL